MNTRNAYKPVRFPLIDDTDKPVGFRGKESCRAALYHSGFRPTDGPQFDEWQHPHTGEQRTVTWSHQTKQATAQPKLAVALKAA